MPTSTSRRKTGAYCPVSHSHLLTPFPDVYSSYGRPTTRIPLHGPNLLARSKRDFWLHLNRPSSNAKKRSSGRRDSGRCLVGISVHTSYSRCNAIVLPAKSMFLTVIGQESLATSFQGMNLHEEALDTYEELESLFFQVLKEKSLTWFGSLITPSAKDDSSPLLSITKKSYRDLILANSISVFDFRVYLLAQQCALLSNLGRVIDVGHKAVAFLRAFGRRLREIEVSFVCACLYFDSRSTWLGSASGLLCRVLDVLVCVERSRAMRRVGETSRIYQGD